MMLNRQFDDLVHLLVSVASVAPERFRSEVIAAHLDLHEVRARRLLKRLSRAGFVVSRGGPDGGAALARSTARIDLGTLLELADPKAHTIDRRVRRPGRFSPTYCLDRAVDQVVERAAQAFGTVLAETTVADLMAAMRDLQWADWDGHRKLRIRHRRG
jgi:DNA-binding IscR family transcriptional regulator